jgi:molybdopterin-guanine dinucleotide biosynthesis protein A
MSHAAVLLAGGKSSRMGRDKSALVASGKPLWRHQLATLRATEPAELFISGKCDGPYADCGLEVVPDEFPDRGPLGGIVSVLHRCMSKRLLVLAVDMPAMTAGFLRALLEQSQRHATGIVPALLPAGRLEPLAAVYPLAALRLAEECLRAGERRLETFIRALEAAALMTILPIEAGQGSLFMNWNRPDDVAGKPME